MDKSFRHKNIHNICAQSLADLMYVNLCTWTSSTSDLEQSSASSPIISPSSVNYTTICKQVLLPLCVSHVHNLHFFYFMSVSSQFHVNCITMQLSKSFSRSALFSSSPSWMEEEKKTGEKKKKERSWVMDALCLSVIPNYWTLPFKTSLHFSFLPFWLMKSRLWLGALCFKHCLTSLSAFTSATICHIARFCSAMQFFLICYSHVQLSCA